jgi:hypothetical protein
MEVAVAVVVVKYQVIEDLETLVHYLFDHFQMLKSRMYFGDYMVVV